MLCVIKEIYTAYTSFICICVFYSLKIVVHLNIYVSNPQVSTAFEGTSLGSFPTCRGSPTKKYKMLIPHPSPVLMHSSDEFVGCESWRFTYQEKQKTVFPQTNIYRKCFSPRWEARYLFHGKKLCGETSSFQPNLTWKCWDGNSGSEKVGWSSKIFVKGLHSASSRHQSMMDPWGLNPWVVKPVGARSNYRWPDKWVVGVITTLLVGGITPVLSDIGPILCHHIFSISTGEPKFGQNIWTRHYFCKTNIDFVGSSLYEDILTKKNTKFVGLTSAVCSKIGQNH